MTTAKMNSGLDTGVPTPFYSSVAPKPAIIIPTFERPLSLMRAVTSALRALPHNGDLIVIDDGISHLASQTLAVIDDVRLVVIATDGHQGPSAARNLGAAYTDADVLFFLDDDDVMFRDYVHRTMEVLRKTCREAVFGFSATLLDQKLRAPKMTSGLISSSTPLENRLAGLGMGFWVKRDAFHLIGGLDETIKINEDTDFCLRLAENGFVGWYSSEPGTKLRPKVQSLTEARNLSLTEQTPTRDRLMVFRHFLGRYADLLASDHKLRTKFAFRAAKYHARCDGVWHAFRETKQFVPTRSWGALLLAVLFWKLFRFKRMNNV